MQIIPLPNSYSIRYDTIDYVIKKSAHVWFHCAFVSLMITVLKTVHVHVIIDIYKHEFLASVVRLYAYRNSVAR